MADVASKKTPSVAPSKKSNLGSEMGSSPKAAKKNVSASAPSQLDGAESHVPETEKGTQNGHNEEEVSPNFWSSAPRTARDIFSYSSHNVLRLMRLVQICID